MVSDAITQVLKMRQQKGEDNANMDKTPKTKKSQGDNNKPKPIIALVVPFHPQNPHFQYEINKIWQNNESNLKNLISRPIVALKRPKNLKDILTKARFGPPAIPNTHNPTQHLMRRRITSYDKKQLLAPIKYCLFTCGAHDIIHDQSNTLTEAIESDDFLAFCHQHITCGKINMIPIQVEHRVTVKCTECNFNQSILSTKRIKRLESEILNAVDTIRKSLHRNV